MYINDFYDEKGEPLDDIDRYKNQQIIKTNFNNHNL